MYVPRASIMPTVTYNWVGNVDFEHSTNYMFIIPDTKVIM